MEKNKTGRYFKYAIGEIILVVIGILIAVSINSWNNQRNLVNNNEVCLTKLNKELNSNTKRLDFLAFNKGQGLNIVVKNCLYIMPRIARGL
jgi:hypothetical protein